jgi:hypothetical protein
MTLAIIHYQEALQFGCFTPDPIVTTGSSVTQEWIRSSRLLTLQARRCRCPATSSFSVRL